MLVLFDIDGTLLRTNRAGTLAMQDAARELFGDHFTFDGVDTAGRLDPLIWDEVAGLNQLEHALLHHDRFRETYARRLAERLQRHPTVEALPDVTRLLEALGSAPDIALGLLTGNYPETGRLKIEHAGLDPDLFTVAAWGIDGRHRRDLPAVARQRYRERFGRVIDNGKVVIIGDTPHDVDCARHHGCRSLAVATGSTSLEALIEAGPDHIVADLSDTPVLVQWLTGRTLAAR